MRYKREEAFRYTFGRPKSALFRIVKIDNQPVDSSPGEGKLIDISPEGGRLASTLNIPDSDHKEIQLSISFNLNQKEFALLGNMMWKKQKGVTYEYGIHLDVDDSTKQDLIDELKVYSKNVMNHK